MIYTIGDLRKMIKDLPDDARIGIEWYGDDPGIDASISLPEISVQELEDGPELRIFVEVDFWEDDPDDIDEHHDAHCTCNDCMEDHIAMQDPSIIKPDEIRRDGIMYDDSQWK